MANRTAFHHGEGISLDKHEAVSLRRLSRRREIVCLDGAIWVTFNGDNEDYLLKTGDCLRSKERRHPVIYAIEKSAFCVRKH